MNIPFKVVTVSANPNSFGLYSVILLSQEGFACSGLLSMYNKPSKGDIVQVVCDVVGGELKGVTIPSAECPQVETNAPIEVIKEIWGEENIKYNTDLIKTYSLQIRGDGTIKELLNSLKEIVKAVESADVGELEDKILYTEFFEE